MFHIACFLLFCLSHSGPLLDEGLDVQCVPFKQRKELTFFLTGKCNTDYLQALFLGREELQLEMWQIKKTQDPPLNEG